MPQFIIIDGIVIGWRNKVIIREINYQLTVDVAESTGRLMLNLMVSVAQFERETTAFALNRSDRR